MEQNIKINPLNVRGKYYVDQESCLDHDCCGVEAPNNFRLNTTSYGAYVFKQPENANEEKQCKAAMDCCPMEAIHHDGNE